MATVDIVDRADMTEKLKGMLELNPKQTAIVTIDMHPVSYTHLTLPTILLV